MRRITLLTALAGLMLALPAGVHPAAAQDQPTCKFAMDVTLSPGLSFQGGSGTFTSGGPSGATATAPGSRSSPSPPPEGARR